MSWFVLGFTAEDIVTSWQHTRLARVIDKVWRQAGQPAGFRLLETAGEGDHLLLWYLSPEAAELLDRCAVPWRGFVLDEVQAPPDGAQCALGP